MFVKLGSTNTSQALFSLEIHNKDHLLNKLPLLTPDSSIDSKLFFCVGPLKVVTKPDFYLTLLAKNFDKEMILSLSCAA